jgi:iron complex outermembrane receptor protein
LRRIFFCGAALSALALQAGAAWAQTPQTPPANPPVDQTAPAAEQAPADRVVITGSRIAKDAFSSASPIVVITAETSALQGQVNTADILQNTSIANGSTQINGQLGGFLVEGGPGVRTVALRGLGSQRTLVLLNGRRLGGAGTTGSTGAVDLNVIPDSIVQRYEILKDGASSIYGSDAVAGVVNVITRNSVDRPELNFQYKDPGLAGGTSWEASGAYGLNFDNGGITLAGSWQHQDELDIKQRSYLRCAEDYVFYRDTGFRADITNTRPGDPDGYKCKNITNNVVQVLGSPVGGNGNNIVYVTDPNNQVGLLPGMRPRTTVAGGVADIDYYSPLTGEQDAINSADLYSFFATADFDLGPVDFYSELLLNRRESQVDNVSNIAPLVAQDNPFNPYPSAAGTVGAARAFIVRPFNSTADVNYLSFVAGLKGGFGNSGWLSSWTWDTYASYNRSEGTYVRQVVDARNLESLDNPFADVHTFVNGSNQIVCQRISDPSISCPVINYLSLQSLAGAFTKDQFDFLFQNDKGKTDYDQLLFSATVTGDLFKLPAGPLGLAAGVEYRDISLDDRPGPISQGGYAYNTTIAGRTKGSDNVTEVFGELNIPILKGLPFAEELTGSLSGRWFDYDSAGSDTVYKIGLNYQVNSLIRFRSTYGTSYRAPALYELFLANQVGFQSQTAIDPCINWGQSSDVNVQNNCASLGIPDNYAGIGSGADIISGGGNGVLKPETSVAKTFGIILTPTQLDLSIALDYFDIKVSDEISKFGAAAIVGACYGSPTFPNGFCNLLTRDLDPASTSYRGITEVRDSYLNINKQLNRGLDLDARYEHEFDFGKVLVELNGTWTFKDQVDLFQGGSSGFATDDFNGSVSEPDFTAGSHVSLTRGDWTYSWFTTFISRASNDELYGTPPLAGYTNNAGAQVVTLKRYAEATTYHDISVRYKNDDWSVTVGFDNVFDEHPPAISTSSGSTRLGIVPVFGTQYDLLGRTGFIQVQKKF